MHLEIISFFSRNGNNTWHRKWRKYIIFRFRWWWTGCWRMSTFWCLYVWFELCSDGLWWMSKLSLSCYHR